MEMYLNIALGVLCVLGILLLAAAVVIKLGGRGIDKSSNYEHTRHE